MIRPIIPHSAQPQLNPNIHISLLSHLSLATNPFQTFLVPLPRRATIHAADLDALGGAARPLLEAGFVDVVAATGFAKDNFFGRGGEVAEADGAVAGDGFAV